MVIELEAPAVAPGRVDLFSIKGQMYTIPESIPANIVLQAMDISRTDGEQAAGIYMMKAALGPEAWQALCDFDGLTEEHMTSIAEQIQQQYFGETEAKLSGKAPARKTTRK